MKTLGGCALCHQPPDAPIHIPGIVSSSHAYVSPVSGNSFPEPPVRPPPPRPVEYREGFSRPVPADLGCKLPPRGWWCSREPGHDGPCAARRKSPQGARSLRQRVGQWLKALGARLSDG